MANLPESNTWEAGIYQIETTDFVVGGVNGTSNAQAKQLANRTVYLKTQVEAAQATASNALTAATTDASATQAGRVSTGAQIFAGDKTFSSTGHLNLTLNAADGSEANLFFKENNSEVAGEYWAVFKAASDNSLRFFNGAIRATLTSEGLGIGTTAPHAPLQFANQSGNKIIFYEFGNNDHQVFGISMDAPNDLLQYRLGNTFGAHVWYAGTSSTTSNRLMKLQGNGVLTFGLDDFRITASQSVTTFEQWGGSSYASFTFSGSGTGTATDWVATSDRRKKTNIKLFSESVLEKVQAIGRNVFSYEWKESGRHEIGFIAQELRTIAPEYVSGRESDNEFLAVNYSKMVVPLYLGMAELIERVAELERRLN